MLTDVEFTQAVNHHLNTVYRTAYNWLKDSHLANDIAQNVFLKLYTAEKDFESDEHVKRWLIRITVNECKNLFRAPWRKHEDIDAYANDLCFEDHYQRELFDAVMRLDRKYRLPLMLFYYEGYSISDISEITGIPGNTISTRLSRARTQLRGLIEEDDNEQQ